MGRKLIYLDDVIEALIEKGQASKRYSLSEEWELNYTEICDVIEDLPSAEPEIIYCRKCKFASGDSRICMKFGHSPIGELDFCAWAERRTDE